MEGSFDTSEGYRNAISVYEAPCGLTKLKKLKIVACIDGKTRVFVDEKTLIHM